MVETTNHKLLARQDSRLSVEAEHMHERDLIIPRFDALIIGGPSGIFKTTTAEMIAGINLDPRNFEAQAKFHLDGVPGPIKVGQWVRAETEARTGQPFIENFEVKIEDDRRYDDEVRQQLENARKPKLVVSSEGISSQLGHAAIIVEGRYAPFIAADVAEVMAGRRYAPKIERAIIYSSNQEERQKIEIARELSRRSGHLSPEELARLGLARELVLSQKAQLLFPELVMGQYILDPDMKTREGNEVYTIKIDANKNDGTLKSPAELTEELYLKLKERSSIFIINKQDFAETSEGESAYEVIKLLQHCQGLLEGNPCNRYGIRTVDVYSGNDMLVQIPACSSDHARNIQLRIERESEEGYIFSKNGIPPNRDDEPQINEDERSKSAREEILYSSLMREKRIKKPKKNGQNKHMEVGIAPGSMEESDKPRSRKFKSGETRHPNRRHPSNEEKPDDESAA